MPVIHTHVSVPTTPEQREALKTAYDKAATAVPSKSEGWLMCPSRDNMPIYFGDGNDQLAAYVEVNVFGRSVPGSTWEELTESIMVTLNFTPGILEDRTYIRYTAITDWGWNDGNFQLPPFPSQHGCSHHLWEARWAFRLTAQGSNFWFAYASSPQSASLAAPLKEGSSDVENPPVAGLLRFKGLISNIQKLYQRFEGLLKRENRSINIAISMVILRIPQSKSPLKRR